MEIFACPNLGTGVLERETSRDHEWSVLERVGEMGGQRGEEENAGESG